mgnify:CR=1 FL=1
MADDWCSVQEAAEMLGVSAETVRKRIKDGILRGRKEGRKYLVSRQDVEQHLANITPTIGLKVGQDTGQLEMELRLANERIRMLQEQIDSLKGRIRDLEADKGFLLEQIREKDDLISKLTPLALPKPKTSIRSRFRRLFGKGDNV